MSVRLSEHSEVTPAASRRRGARTIAEWLGSLAEATPRIAEIDLNPAIVHPNGEGISLIHARVRLSD